LINIRSNKEQLMSAQLFSIIAVALVLNFVVFEVRAEQEPGESAGELSPLVPPLVREGDFAIKLAEVLGLGEIADEDDAGRLLVELGLSPRNGWIADYPVTPVILAELREAVIASSESGSLAMTYNEALEAFDRLALDLGLSVDENADLEFVTELPAEGSSPDEVPYAGSFRTHDDYTTDGPPIMTYYPPPSHYYRYYDWVPYPFYFSRSYYSGFFILHDFHRAHKFDRHFHRNHKHKQFGFHNRFKRKSISNYHWNRQFGQPEIVRPNSPERAERFGSGGRSRFKSGGIGSGKLESRSLDNRGSKAFTFRSAGKRDFPKSLRGTGRRESVTPDRRFSSERREFRDSRSRGKRDASIRSSTNFRREGADSLRSAGSLRRGSEGSFRSFRFNGRDGRDSGSFRSFNSSNRVFSAPGGGIGRGRR